MPNIIIEDTDGYIHNYTIPNYCTGRELYNAVLGVTGLGKPKYGCDGLTADAIRVIFQGREIPNNNNTVYGLRERSRVFVVYNERGGSSKMEKSKQKINFHICLSCDL